MLASKFPPSSESRVYNPHQPGSTVPAPNPTHFP